MDGHARSDAHLLDRDAAKVCRQALTRAKSVSDPPAAFPVSTLYRRARALTVTANQTDRNGGAPTSFPLHAVGGLRGDDTIQGRRAFVSRSEVSQEEVIRKLHGITDGRSRAKKLQSAVQPGRTRSRSASPNLDAPGRGALKGGGVSCPSSVAPYSEPRARRTGSRCVEGLHPVWGRE